MDKTESAHVAAMVDWLEKTQREDSGRIEQLEEKLERLWTKAHDQELKQRAAEDALVAIQAAVQRLGAVEELARQVSERHERLTQDVLEWQQRAEKAGRAQQMENERLRQDLTDLTQRMDYLAHEAELLAGRISPLSDGLRREQEIWIEYGQKLEALRHQDDELASRTHVTSELAKRNAHDIEVLRQEIEPLRRQDDIAASRIQIVSDHARHLGEQLEVLPALDQGLKELNERFQVHRIEQQRAQASIEAVRADLNDQLVRAEEQNHQLKQLEERRQAATEQILALRSEVAQHRQEIDATVVDWQRLVEQHRVADIAEAERQLREIKQRSARFLRGGPA